MLRNSCLLYMFDDNSVHDQIMELIPRGLMAVKSEYETEGISREELQYTVLTCKQLSLPIALKIGGCGAISDLYDCKRYSIDYVIAPMIESAYAVKKYEQSINTNPLPWTEHWLNSRSLQNAPQETEIESYVIGGVKQDVKKDQFKTFKL